LELSSGESLLSKETAKVLAMEEQLEKLKAELLEALKYTVKKETASS